MNVLTPPLFLARVNAQTVLSLADGICSPNPSGLLTCGLKGLARLALYRGLMRQPELFSRPAKAHPSSA